MSEECVKEELSVVVQKRKQQAPCEHGVPNGGQFCKIGFRLGLACGKGLCVHEKQKYSCKDCGRNRKRLCEHGNIKQFCKTGYWLGLACGRGLCKHRKQKYTCTECGKRRKKGCVIVPVSAAVQAGVAAQVSEAASEGGVLQGPQQLVRRLVTREVWELKPVEAVEACVWEAAVESEEEWCDDYEGELPDFGD